MARVDNRLCTALIHICCTGSDRRRPKLDYDADSPRNRIYAAWENDTGPISVKASGDHNGFAVAADHVPKNSAGNICRLPAVHNLNADQVPGIVRREHNPGQRLNLQHLLQI